MSAMSNGGLNQRWRLEDAGDGYYRILAQHGGKCLGVAKTSTDDHTRLVQYTCGTGANQQFKGPIPKI